MLYRPATGRPGRTQLLRHSIAASVLHDLGQRVAEWWRIRRGIHRLAALDDRLLADIGIKRDEIASRVRGGR
jgi:uncharacterized protein YjiS (DUF1127 family)